MCGEKKCGKGSAKWRHPVSLVFHIAGMGLAVAAAALMATASQCTVYADYGARPRTVTYKDFPAFMYLVVATSIAAALEAVAIFLNVFRKGKMKKAGAVLMPLLAAAAPALLYTAAGAAFGAGWDIYYYMEPTSRRYSICSSSVGSRFCAQAHVSMWLALTAGVAVSLAAWALTARWCHGGGGGGGGSDSSSDSDSDSDSVCGHGCHSKH